MSRRIALICPYALDVNGGVQEQAMAMSRELQRRGHEVTLIAPAGEPIAIEGVSVHQLGRRLSIPANGSKAPITLSLGASRRVTALLDESRAEVVHFHEPFAPLLGYAELLRAKRPHIGTFHRSGGGPAYSLTGPLLRRLLAGVPSRVAVSASAADTLRRATGATATVLFNGFETERFHNGERPVRPNLLFIGRAEERKGLGTLLEMHARHGDEFDVTLIGRGTQEAWVKAGRPSGVTALDAVSDEEKRHYLGVASALVAPSLYGESFGLIVIEALASGTPVVASDIDGYRMAAGGCATLFAPGDAEDLYRAVRVALVRDDAARQRGIARATEFSMSSLMDHYLNLYEEIISQDRHG